MNKAELQDKYSGEQDYRLELGEILRGIKDIANKTHISVHRMYNIFLVVQDEKTRLTIPRVGLDFATFYREVNSHLLRNTSSMLTNDQVDSRGRLVFPPSQTFNEPSDRSPRAQVRPRSTRRQ